MTKPSRSGSLIESRLAHVDASIRSEELQDAMRVPHLTDDDSQAPRVRVLVALHDTLITDAFALLLREAGFQVASCSGDPPALIEQAVQSSHDVIIIGSDVVIANGTSPTLPQLRLLAPSTRIVVLLRDGDELCARVLLQHAVNGVVRLNARANEVVAILRQVLDGQVVYPSLLIERYAAAPETYLLSERQREVLEQLALGRSNDEIARRLYISRNTVKFHLREIYSRLGVRNRVEATAPPRARRGRGGTASSCPDGWASTVRAGDAGTARPIVVPTPTVGRVSADTHHHTYAHRMVVYRRREGMDTG